MKDIRDKEFDQFFRDKLEDLTAGVPGDMWERISKELEDGQEKVSGGGHIMALVPEKKLLRNRWWRYAAAIALLLGISAVWMNRPKEVIYLNAGSQFRERAVDRVETTENKGEIGELSAGQYAQANSSEEGKSEIPVMARQERKSEGMSDIIKQSIERKVEKTDEMELVEEGPMLAHNTNMQREEEVDAQVNRIETIVVEENTYAMLDATPEEPIVIEEANALGKKNFDVSHVLNYVVGVVDKGEDKVLAFKRDDEGSISIALNFRSLRKKKQEYIN
ncbi:hypothetical protein [Olivibacter sitiensis]|uniref:hypothetical protein n=1 Tax=Olivibacter sitiensis TaxID=376470 RepID=UPI0004033EA6|nr:hypothetical protein [Olivibacter sitiensis]